MEFHEAANLFPMEMNTIDELANDILEYGQAVTVKILDGKILDGRRRYTACQRVGVDPKIEHVFTDDPVAYVLSLNLHRRHLDKSQRAMVAGEAIEIWKRQARERMEATLKQNVTGKENLPEREKGQSRDKAGKALGVSGKSVDFALKVLGSGDKELIDSVKAGKVTVSKAAKMVDKQSAEKEEKLAPPPKEEMGTDVPTPPKKEKKYVFDNDAIAGTAMYFLAIALGNMNRIMDDDPDRTRAFQEMIEWCQQQIGE